MKPQHRPMFLAPRPYRRRRLRDAARLLPFLGLLLLTLPALWSPAGTEGRSLAGDLVYFFGIWALLLAVAAAFAPSLGRPEGSEDEDED